MGRFIQVTAPDGFQLPVYLAEPAGKPRGAMVVVQEIFGVNAHIQDVAQRYAEAGYLALAPAIFERIEPGVNLGYTPDDMKRGVALKAALEAAQPAAAGDIQATILAAAAHSGTKVGIVGFCYGGLLAWRAACTAQGLSAAVCYYGGGMTTPAEAARTPQVPVLAHFGERDSHISLESVQAFGAAHRDDGVALYTYAADHGFNCDQRGAFDADAARLAWQRSSAFLQQQLEA